MVVEAAFQEIVVWICHCRDLQELGCGRWVVDEDTTYDILLLCYVRERDGGRQKRR